MMNEQDKAYIDIVRRFYETEFDLIADDIVWHVPGRNQASGDYVGRKAYSLDMPSRMAPLDRWDFTLEHVMVNREHVVAIFRLQGERKGKKIDIRGAHVLRLNSEGKIVEGRGFASDQDALDEFFS